MHIFSNWFGSVPIVDLTAQSISTTRAGATTSARYTLTSAGAVQRSNANGTTFTTAVEDWISPLSAAGAGYDVYCTVNSGTLSAGGASEATWLSLGTSRLWQVTKGSLGTNVAQITVKIRDAASLVELETGAVIDLSAEYA